ncbi:MAG: PIG-L family deacetylase [Spirochaetales bacterium]|nr:PIG-L family deacetylase [Spirochaetales bacterium]
MENKIVCVIAVHPDDETLGCGGTILKHLSNGDKVYCVFVTGGNAEQSKLINSVSNKYEFTGSFELNLPELDLADLSLNSIIPKISAVFSEIKPQILYMPNRSDVHSDHKQIFNAVLACTKSFRYPFIEKILMMEVISETDFTLSLPEDTFIPNYFVDVSEYYEKKLDILKTYESEMLPYPQTRNESTMTALNRYRGSQAGCEYAEAFMLVKAIER